METFSSLQAGDLRCHCAHYDVTVTDDLENDHIDNKHDLGRGKNNDTKMHYDILHMINFSVTVFIELCP